MVETQRINQQFRLYIEKAKNLAKKDIFGASDPYVKVYIVNRRDGLINPPKTKHIAKTRVIKNTLNPSWKEQFPLSFDPSINTVLLEVWDENRLTPDDFLGQVEIQKYRYTEIEKYRWVCRHKISSPERARGASWSCREVMGDRRQLCRGASSWASGGSLRYLVMDRGG